MTADEIAKSVEHLIDRRFIELKTGKKYTFIGVIIGSDDYYYGLYCKNSKKRRLLMLSCVGDIEAFGFELIE